MSLFFDDPYADCVIPGARNPRVEDWVSSTAGQSQSPPSSPPVARYASSHATSHTRHSLSRDRSPQRSSTATRSFRGDRSVTISHLSAAPRRSSDERRGGASVHPLASGPVRIQELQDSRPCSASSRASRGPVTDDGPSPRSRLLPVSSAPRNCASVASRHSDRTITGAELTPADSISVAHMAAHSRSPSASRSAHRSRLDHAASSRSSRVSLTDSSVERVARRVADQRAEAGPRSQRRQVATLPPEAESSATHPRRFRLRTATYAERYSVAMGILQGNKTVMALEEET